VTTLARLVAAVQAEALRSPAIHVVGDVARCGDGAPPEVAALEVVDAAMRRHA
jgi:siroheme synthase